MTELDARSQGEMTSRLDALSRESMEGEDVLDPARVPLERPKGPFVMPDCANCTDTCCVHDVPDSGILLSLRDIAQLMDSGLSDVVHGTFTFKRTRKGKLKPEIDTMPRLAKKDGLCIFYDGATRRCTGYGTRPTICRRFPYEVHYRSRTGNPYARFIGWADCPTVTGGEHEESILQMVRDAVHDENVSLEDAVLLEQCVDELREAGFDFVLPPPDECP
ncbi:MAG: YkgJ family cysteine cluster protein [Gemmatimonadota bacterium]|jgi:Fe-S-cluster containining protein|nr:YkgJ family cysteine cluster protein [Gemmatimonadota bacterium]MDP6528267.1 YkgJ family cysteine cluster protein [Gemmatimonadota bacterium]MDP6802509.1 YkgJ family cysteine cluster protein [Gemmatimonadota bacterium]MDP7031772.1 YkgJ family cysteine cluster protein [Gemmatimonadota bacterium]